jgi:uncharacterized protein YndB with AHSA1/START domain
VSRVARTEQAVDIAAPPEVIFPWLARPALLMRWVGGMVECQAETEAEEGVGSRLRQVVVDRGTRIELTGETVRYEPNELLEVHLDSPGTFQAVSVHRLSPHGEGHTRLVTSLETELGPRIGRLIAPIVSRVASSKLRSDLDRLRRLVEAAEAES